MSDAKTTTQIHDLGYEAYRGPRLPASRRFGVIARNLFGVAWHSRWGVKVPMMIGAAVTLAGAVAMYVLRDRLVQMARHRGAPIPNAEQVIFGAYFFHRLVSGYVLAAVVGCATIADDLRMGAFQFYFSRPLRVRDYLVGKLLGLTLVIGVPMFGGPMVLALVRLLFADDLAQAWALLPVLGHAGLLGLVGTVSLVMPSAALGALLGRRQPAQALFVVYFLVLATAASSMAKVLDLPELALLDLGHDVDIVGRALFDVAPDSGDPGAWLAGGALVVIWALSLFGIVWRISRAETASLGGG